jgi:hypothetical protein
MKGEEYFRRRYLTESINILCDKMEYYSVHAKPELSEAFDGVTEHKQFESCINLDTGS